VYVQHDCLYTIVRDFYAQGRQEQASSSPGVAEGVTGLFARREKPLEEILERRWKKPGLVGKIIVSCTPARRLDQSWRWISDRWFELAEGGPTFSRGEIRPSHIHHLPSGLADPGPAPADKSKYAHQRMCGESFTSIHSSLATRDKNAADSRHSRTQHQDDGNGGNNSGLHGGGGARGQATCDLRA